MHATINEYVTQLNSERSLTVAMVSTSTTVDQVDWFDLG